MLIEQIKSPRRYVVELWEEGPDSSGFDTGFKEPNTEEYYVEINNWCIETLGYHARTAFNRFEFRKEKHLTMFVLRWA